MSTFVVARAYSHSVTYVAGKLLQCLQDIVKGSGLDPSKISMEWVVLENGLSVWLKTEDLRAVTLEVFTPRTYDLVGRWDFTIVYTWTEGSENFWVDTDQIYYAIRKQGLWPSDCDYRIIADTKLGRPDVEGWSSTTYRSTEGFVRQSIGTTLDASGLGATATYYRRK
jgi:Bacterial HORMA domain 2